RTNSAKQSVSPAVRRARGKLVSACSQCRAFQTRLRLRDNPTQTFERFLLNYAALDLTKWSFQTVSAGTVFIDHVSRTGNINKGCQRMKSVEVVVGINLFRRDEHLWTNTAVAFVDGYMIDGDHRLESKLDLRPD